MTTNTTATCVADDQYSAQIIRAWCASCGMPEPSNGECLALSVALSTAAAQPPAGWMPIETAPKDGTRVILSWGCKAINGFYLDNSATDHPWQGWRTESMVPRPAGNPDAWQPFPRVSPEEIAAVPKVPPMNWNAGNAGTTPGDFTEEIANSISIEDATGYEHQHAIMEAERNDSLEQYQKGAGLLGDTGIRIYEAGFGNGWNRALAAAPKAEPAPAGEHPALHDLFREALAWGMTYGPEIPAHQWDEMRESMVKQYADRAMRDQPAVAPAAPTPSEWDVRGRLAASLTCWHRLTGQEAAELVALFQGHPAQAAPAAVAGPFQARVQPWLLACFGEMIAGDREERNHRFLEEALELVQSLGCTQSEAHQLVDYVYGRTVGIPAQEVGGVMVTLAALCLANGMDMHDAGEVELTRINDPVVVEKIRAKQAAKPKYSPLPMAAPLTQVAPRPAAQQGKPSAYALKWPNVLRINLSTVFDTEAEAQAYLKRCTPGVVMVPLYANPAAPVVQGDALIDAARFASDVLAEVYTKYQVKIGPFASQAQLANVRLRDALKGAARSQAKEGGAA